MRFLDADQKEEREKGRREENASAERGREGEDKSVTSCVGGERRWKKESLKIDRWLLVVLGLGSGRGHGIKGFGDVARVIGVLKGIKVGIRELRLGVGEDR